MAKSKSDTEPDDKYYQELGHQLANIYNLGYANRKKAYWFSLVKGILTGLGGVIGATVGIALLIWILSLFTEIPLIGHFLDNLQNTLNQRH